MQIQLGESSDLKALQQALTLKDRQVLDIGCGKGEFAAALAELGAHATGVEPDPVQAQKNREAEPITGLTLIEAGAESLPLEDNSQDILIFRFSLHHIPYTLHSEVFTEAARVLRHGGSLYVIEPIAEGSSQQVMELFHDETEVRALAQKSLQELPLSRFEHKTSYRYDINRTYTDFDAYLQRYGQMSYNHYTRDQVDNDTVKTRFYGFQVEGGEVVLNQPVRADLYTLR